VLAPLTRVFLKDTQCSMLMVCFLSREQGTIATSQMSNVYLPTLV